MPPHDEEEPEPDDRLRALAAILAKAVLRLQARGALPAPPEEQESDRSTAKTP